MIQEVEHMSTLNETPVANRTHIAIFGRRNAGKSTLINALTNQKIAVVSDIAGTTTDPVYKSMEFLPIGPVVMVDTAGFDDVGPLGELRMEKTYEVLRKTDLAILVISAVEGISSFELDFIKELKAKSISAIVAVNKCDLIPLSHQDAVKMR
jgi:small GTP-binding protein